MRQSPTLLRAFLLSAVVTPLAFGQSWNSEIVDSTGSVGWFASLALDSDDKPHIAYHDSSNLTLKYATHNGTIWQTETADATYGAGFQSSIAIDTQGRPHISYNEEAGDDLRYAWFDGATWQIEIVDSERNTGEFTSIALDSEDHAHIAYIHHNDGRLRFAEFDGTAWTIHDIADTSTIAATSLALDNSDSPHIAFRTSSTLKYATYDGNTWTEEVVSSGVGGAVDIEIDPNGHILIMYSQGSSVKCAEYDGVSWSISSVDETGDANGQVSMAISSAGRRHAAFSTSDSIAYLVQDGGTWHRENVLSTNSNNAFLSLAVSQAGSPLLTFNSVLDRDLVFASCNQRGTWSLYGSGWPGTNGIPNFEPSEGPVIGQSLQLELDNSRGAPTTALLLVGRDRAFVPTPFDGTVLVGPTSLSSMRWFLPLNTGTTPVSFVIPDDASLLGSKFTLQALELDPGASKGISFTAGIELIVGDC